MNTPADVSKDWLKTRITVEHAEAKHMVPNPRLGEKPVAFGFVNEHRREFLACTQNSDELWEYSSSDHSWEHFAGREGIALVRKGEGHC